MIEEKDFDIDKLNDLIKQILTNYAYKKNIMTNLNQYYKFDPKKKFIEIINGELC